MQEELQTMLKDCHLCPRNCGVDRLAGQKGFCGVDAGIMVARAAFICGKNRVFQEKKAPGRCFFPAVPWDVRSARTGRFPKAER